jgi:hypothetical protein
LGQGRLETPLTRVGIIRRDQVCSPALQDPAQSAVKLQLAEEKFGQFE